MANQKRDKSLQLAIIDDDAAFRSVVHQIAEPFGWQISEFSNGRDLIAAITGSLRTDLIVLDMVMPEFDGIETIGGIGALSFRCPIILISGRLPIYMATACELGQAVDVEIIDILQKPVSLKRLGAALNPELLIGRR